MSRSKKGRKGRSAAFLRALRQKHGLGEFKRTRGGNAARQTTKSSGSSSSTRSPGIGSMTGYTRVGVESKPVISVLDEPKP